MGKHKPDLGSGSVYLGPGFEDTLLNVFGRNRALKSLVVCLFRSEIERSPSGTVLPQLSDDLSITEPKPKT